MTPDTTGTHDKPKKRFLSKSMLSIIATNDSLSHRHMGDPRAAASWWNWNRVMYSEGVGRQLGGRDCPESQVRVQ